MIFEVEATVKGTRVAVSQDFFDIFYSMNPIHLGP